MTLPWKSMGAKPSRTLRWSRMSFVVGLCFAAGTGLILGPSARTGEIADGRSASKVAEDKAREFVRGHSRLGSLLDTNEYDIVTTDGWIYYYAYPGTRDGAFQIFIGTNGLVDLFFGNSPGWADVVAVPRDKGDAWRSVRGFLQILKVGWQPSDEDFSEGCRVLFRPVLRQAKHTESYTLYYSDGVRVTQRLEGWGKLRDSYTNAPAGPGSSVDGARSNSTKARTPETQP